jgi:GH25 family lysozyme M1 (1,4-beta-N-acetylmuramidase)
MTFIKLRLKQSYAMNLSAISQISFHVTWLLQILCFASRITLAALFFCAWPHKVVAQNYAIDWSTIASGGGFVGDGTNQIEGTIGQWDTGTMTGGVFAIEGGFWPGPGSDSTVQLGIDVSSVRGAIDWEKVRGAGKVFAFIKATEGGDFVDTNFAVNVQNARANGLMVGAYHFARPLNNPGTLGALAEASNFLHSAGNYVGKGYLPPVLDIEDDPNLNGDFDQCLTANDTVDLTCELGASLLSEWVRTWCSAVSNQTGISPILYMTKNYARNGMESDLSTYPLWVATVGNSPDNPGTNLGPWGTNWSFHQYDPNGTVDGVNNGVSPVDLDSFNGSLSEFGKIVIGGPPPPSFAGENGGPLTPPSGGQFKFKLSSAFIQQVVVQASDDLKSWTDVRTLTFVDGQTAFTDTNAASHEARFYRLKP